MTDWLALAVETNPNLPADIQEYFKKVREYKAHLQRYGSCSAALMVWMATWFFVTNGILSAFYFCTMLQIFILLVFTVCKFKNLSEDCDVRLSYIKSHYFPRAPQ